VYWFVLSRRWIAFAVLVAALALLCVRLGIWQFHRLAERHASNAVIERNLAAAPVGLDTVSPLGDTVPDEVAWRRVRATGTFDVAHQILVRYQTRNGALGVDVLTPLRRSDGSSVLVDRGWLQTGNNITDTVQPPAPPAGTVTMTGWLMPDQDGSSDQLRVQSGSVRLVSSEAIAPTLPYPIHDGYVAMTSSNPPPTVDLQPPDAPQLNSGPHFFYGLQWFFFAGLAVFGWFYFAYAEAQNRRRAAADQPAPAAQSV
jgi:cytochrome oxidase assembly protein ShyY1